MRRPVRINYLWYPVGTLKVLIPATDGELEATPPGSTHAAELFWILPDGGAHSRRLTQSELEQYVMFRQLEYSDLSPQGRRANFPRR